MNIIVCHGKCFIFVKFLNKTQAAYYVQEAKETKVIDTWGLYLKQRNCNTYL